MSNQAPLARRNRLLASCAAAAIATITVHAPVRAQTATGFNGVTLPGTQGATPNGTNTVVTVNAPRAIINWQANNNNFLASGDRVDFVNNSVRVGQDYIVLNRITPVNNSGRIELNGTIRSTLSNDQGGSVGGKIWFYSPTGLLVGSEARINVGSLLLTANNVLDEDFLDGNTSYRFLSGANSTAAVDVSNGAQINALGTDAYIALIAPRVVQSGAVRVNGTAAYVAAEDVTMQINRGLFDIAVSVGSSVGGSTKSDAALVHDGSTQTETGYGSDPSLTRQATLVAVPKNEAITMLVSGQFGYRVASGASVSNNKIVLSGGLNVANGSASPTPPSGATGRTDIRITNASPAGGPAQTRFGSELRTRATGDVTVTAVPTNTLDPDFEIPRPDIDFVGEVELRGGNVRVEAQNGSSILFGGVLDLNAGGVETAGTASLIARTGAQIVVQGNAGIQSSLSRNSAPATTAVTAGTAEVRAEGGSIEVRGDLSVTAAAQGGTATGGTARALASGTGRIQTTGDLLLETDANGASVSSGAGGNATGGTAEVIRNGDSNFVIGGSLLASARARGGSGTQAGSGTGGIVSVTSGAGTGGIGVGGFTDLDATGLGEDGYGSTTAGGAGQGGTIAIAVGSGSALTSAGSLFIDTSGRGGFGSTGGSGSAGDVTITTGSGSTLSAQRLNLSSFGTGQFSSSGPGGSASGGDVTLNIGGTAAFGSGGSVDVTASGGGSFTSGGNAEAGQIDIAINGGSLTLGGALNLNAVGDGGSNFGTTGVGGNGKGGIVNISTSNGSFSSDGTLSIDVAGIGARGRTGGDGTGGTATINAAGTGGIEISQGELRVGATGQSGFESGYGSGLGGTGQGGGITLTASRLNGVGGTVKSAGGIQLAATGNGDFGGEGGFGVAAQSVPSGNGGDGFGGTIEVIVDGTLETPDLLLDVSGRGESGSSRGSANGDGGSNGGGGSASISFDGGSSTIGRLTMDARGFGGDGGSSFGVLGENGGDAGAGRGGSVTLRANGTAPTIGSLALLADGTGGTGGSASENVEGTGGSGGRGGVGQGGSLTIEAVNGATLSLPAQLYSASGQGGRGGDAGGGDGGGTGGAGGTGLGGSVTLNVQGSTLTSIGSIASDNGGPSIIFGPSFEALGTGGAGGAGGHLFGDAGAAGTGGAGGSAIGGTVSLALANSDLELGRVIADSSATGGVGGDGGNAQSGVGGNGGAGGSASGTTSTLALSAPASNSIEQQGGILVRSGAAGGAGGSGGYGLQSGAVSGAGGNAVGGSVRVDLNGELSLANLEADATAFGGDGGNGDVLDDFGYGDEAAIGGAGGNATGGGVVLAVGSGNVALADSSLASGSLGGTGGSSLTAEGGAGGKGLGSVAAGPQASVSIQVAGTAVLTAFDLDVSVNGAGGAGGHGGDNATGGDGGRGGDGLGGRFSASTSGQGTLVTAETGLLVSASGFGGTGGNGGDGFSGGDAGRGDGGVVELAVRGGEMDLGIVNLSASGIGGFAQGGSNGGGTGGRITVAVADGAGGGAGILKAGSTILNASGRFGGEEGEPDLGGTIEIAKSSGESSLFELGSLDATAMGGSGAIDIAVAAGTITVGQDGIGNAVLRADDVSIAGTADGAVLIAGDLEISGAQTVTLAQSPTSGQALVTARNIFIAAESVAGSNAGLAALDDLVISGLDTRAGGSVQVGRLFAGDDIVVDADSVAIGTAIVDGSGDEGESGYGDGSNIRLSASGDVRLDNGNAVDGIVLSSGDGSVLSSGLLTAAQLSVSSGRDILLADVSTGSGLFLDAFNGRITGNLFATPGSVALSAGDSIEVAGIQSGGFLSLSAGSDVSLGSGLARSISIFGTDLSLGTLTSNGPLGGEGGNGISLFGSGAVSVGNAESISFIDVTGSSLDAESLVAASFIRAGLSSEAGGTGRMNIGAAEAGGFVLLSGPGAIAVETVAAGTDLAVSGSSITLGEAMAGRDLLLDAGGDVAVSIGQAGDDFIANSGDGAISVGQIVTTGLGEDLPESGYGSGDGSNIRLSAAGAIGVGTATAVSNIIIDGGSLTVASNTLGAGDDISVTTDGDADLGTARAGGGIFVNAGGNIGFVLLESGSTTSLDAGDGIAGDDIDAGGFLFASASGPLTGGRFTSGRSIELFAGGALDVASVAAAGGLRINAGSIDLGSASASGLGGEGGGGISLFSPGLITVGNLTSAAFIDIQANGFDGGALGAGDFVRIRLFDDQGYGSVSARAATSGAIRFDSADAGSFIELSAPGAIDAGTLNAGTDIRANGRSITLADATAGRDILLFADDAISVTRAQAGDDLEGESLFGTITAGSVVTTGLGEDLGEETGYGPAPGDGSNIRLTGAGDIRLDEGRAVDLIALASSGGVVNSAILLQATDLTVASGGDIALADVEVTNALTLNAQNGSITGADFRSGDRIDLTASGLIDVASLDATRSIFAQATGIDLDSATTAQLGGEGGSGITLSSTGTVRLGSADSADFIDISATGVDAGTLQADRFVRIGAFSESGGTGAIAFTSIDAGSFVSLAATGDVNGGTVAAGTSIEATAANVTLASATAGDDLDIQAAGAINLTTGTAVDRMVLRTSATENASTELTAAGRTITAGTLTAGSLTADAAGALAMQTIRTTGNADVESAGAMTLGTTMAGGEVVLAGAGAVTTGAILAGQVRASAGGQLTTGNVAAMAGGVTLAGGAGTLQTGSVAALTTLELDAAGGTITAGDLMSLMSTIDLSASGDLTLGNVRAGGSIFLTGGGAITTGSLTAGTMAGSGNGGGGTGNPGGPSGPTMAGIAPGFDDFAFPANDDGATGAIATPFSLNFFGQTYQQLFVSNNGYVTFNSGQGTFTPSGLGADYSGQPIIAAFFADVDTRGQGSALMTYGNGEFAGRPAFGATWDGVGYFPSQADKLNNFQIVLTDRSDTGGGNFDIYFNYTRISWETGSASGGSNGFGGTSAAVGYNAGTGNQPGTFFELPGSRVNGAFLDGGPMALITGTNNGVPGQLQFQVRSGQVNPGGGTGGSFGTGDIKVTNTAPGNTAAITLGNLAARDIEVTGGGAVTTGAVDANRDVSLTAAGALAYSRSEADGNTRLTGLRIDGGITTAGGDLVANGGLITIAEARAGDDITIRADNAAVIGAVATTGQGTDGEANGFRIDIEAANDVSFGAANAVGDLRVVSRDGGILRLGAPAVANLIEAGGSILLSAARDLTADTLVAGGAVSLTSTAGAVTARRINANGAVSLTAQNGAVTVSQDLLSGQPVTALGRSVALNAAGALSVGSAQATAGNVSLVSGGNLTLGNADASAHVNASSGGTLGVNGTVGGAQITLASRDIAIGSGAQVGTAARTTALQITANGGTAILGGTGQGSGYRLDNAEFGRLAGQTLSFGAQGENALLRVDTLNVRQASVTRTLNLSSSGDVEMVGRLTYENAGADNLVRVTAARAFFADAAGAGIAVTNAQGALTGSLEVDARSILVASRQAQTDLGSAATIADRSTRLGTNDGAADEPGFLRASKITLAASERILVQNSGSSSDPGDARRGLTAGAGGITLVTKGTGPVEIIINGRQEDGAGGFVTGEALIERLTITGQQNAPATFAQGSTVNGCVIGGNNCRPVAVVEPLAAPRDVIQALTEKNSVFAPPPVIGFFQLITTEGGPILPVIDDPVTGSGNDDLVIGFGTDPEDGRVTDRDAVDQPVTGTGNEALQGGSGPLINLDNSERDREEAPYGPVTGTGNEALQGGEIAPAPDAGTPDGPGDVGGPVTGSGNEDLQDGPNR